MRRATSSRCRDADYYEGAEQLDAQDFRVGFPTRCLNSEMSNFQNRVWSNVFVEAEFPSVRKRTFFNNKYSFTLFMAHCILPTVVRHWLASVCSWQSGDHVLTGLFRIGQTIAT